ncbi:DUF2993 domain-containing protein [Okeania sp.]|uniref:LmeA family phospholipid-binding protein n=1 Tax=Okeania sp. TaxID=3100323 RepID=UPI002B4ACF30|nr:DUF2993 domain-containing protein [Okeania sp.]
MNKKSPELHQNHNFNVVESQDKISTKIKSRIVSKFLSPACKFWLKSQLEQVEKLKVNIEGGDRQILTGKIPLVSVVASHVIFQGLHLTEVNLSATDIRINIGQVIKGKPLKILKSFPIFCHIKLLESDFNASLKSHLLVEAIMEFLTPLLVPDFIEVLETPITLHDQKAEISRGHLNFFANLLSQFNAKIPLSLHTDLKLASSCELLLENFNLLVSQKSSNSFSDNIKVDLGSDVELQELKLDSGQLVCVGKLIVNP